jgi:hypothetical protein
MHGERSKNGIFKKIGIAVVCICILSYSVYHFASLFSEEIGTIVAGPTTESEFLTLDGYIFRDSEYIRSDYGGAADYAVTNGEKVAKGDLLARVYSEGNAENVRSVISEIEKRISLLKESTGKKPSVSELASLRAAASGAYSSIMKQIASGKISALDADIKKLLVALNSVAMLTDKDFTINETLTALENARKELLSAGGDSVEVSAHKSGYFYSVIDGYEDTFSGKAARELDADALAGLFESPVSDTSALSYVGKMSYDSKWYYASIIPSGDTSAFEDGAAYVLEFSGGGYYDIVMTLDRKELTSDGKNAALVFSTNLLPSGFAFERRQTVRVITGSVSGIYVPTSAVHRVNFERVVYTLSGSVVKMKYIDVIYEGADYFIVSDGVGEDEDKVYLKSNDLLIIRGSNLFDGRILD